MKKAASKEASPKLGAWLTAAERKRRHAGSQPNINGEWTVPVIDSSTFTIPVNVTTAGTGGTALRKRPCYDFTGDPTNLNGNGYVNLQDITSFTVPAPRKFGTSPGDPGYDPYWDIVPGNQGSGSFIKLSDITRITTGQSEASFNKHCPRKFTYNGDGMRMSQTLGRFATDYVWDVGAGMPMVLQETNREDFLRYSSDPANTAVHRTRTDYKYVYGVGLVSITDGQGNQRYVLPDALGSVRHLTTGADGGVYASYSYDAFGANRPQDGPQTTFGFAGEQYDAKARRQGGGVADPGLYYLRARYYDPTIGRFLTRDPMPGSTRDPQSLNAYPYVQNNPVNRVDPSGMLSESTRDTTLSCIAAGLFLFVAIGFFVLAFITLSPEAIVIADLFLLAGAGGVGGFVYNLDQCRGPDGRT